MPSIDFAQLRIQVTMGQVLDLLGYQPRAIHGDQVRGPCPIHGSTSTTSRIFSANLRRSIFRCFKCQAQGNQLDLWAQVHDLSIYDAAVDLCSKLAIAPPTVERPTEKRNS